MKKIKSFSLVSFTNHALVSFSAEVESHVKASLPIENAALCDDFSASLKAFKNILASSVETFNNDVMIQIAGQRNKILYLELRLVCNLLSLCPCFWYKRQGLFCARAIGCADTPCEAAYAAHTADRPPRYVQAHTRRRV